MDQAFNYRMNIAQQELGSNGLSYANIGNTNRLGEERYFNPHALPRGRDPKFKENLAFYISDGDLKRIGQSLGERVQDDDAARQKWLNIGLDGVDYLGIGSDKARPNFNTRGGDIYAPTLMTTALKVTCKLHAALFPPTGFTETRINGDASMEVEDQAMRMKEFNNYMLTDVMFEYKAEKKQQLWWTVNFGTTFSKIFIDPQKGRPVADYVRPEDIIIDPNASDLAQAERITHRFVLPKRVLEQKYETGIWKKGQLQTDDIYDSQLKQKIGDKIGVQPMPSDDDKRYQFEECMTYLDLPRFHHMNPDGGQSGRALPYIVVKGKESNEVVAIFRNWKEFDPLFRPLEHLAQHKYFTGFNVYGMGLIHMGLGLAKSETEIQNQLIKAAQLSNAPSLIQAAGLRQEKSRIDISPGSITSLQTFDNNINNAITQLQFKEPSGVLLQLKQMQADAINNMSIAREITPENLPSNTAATTTIGILSTMHTLEDSIIGDFYDSFRKEFSILNKIFADWLPDDQPYPFSVPGGQHTIAKSDFTDNIIVRPVMDPNVSAQSMQLIINDALVNLAKENPQLYDLREVQRRLLSSMKVSDIDKILKPEEEPQEPPQLDPLTENSFAILGKPIKAYKAQNQEAHIMVHKALIAQLQADEGTDHSATIAELEAHVREHESFAYMATMQAAMGGAEMPDDTSQIPPQYQDQIAINAAKAVQKQQEAAAKANPPPIDPNQVLMQELQVKQSQVEQKAQESQQDMQIQMQKMQADQAMQGQKAEMEAQRVMLEQQRLEMEKAKLEMEMQMNAQKAEMEMQSQQMKSEQEMQVAQMKNEVEMMKLQLEKEKADQATEVKAFDSTLRYEQSKGTINQNEGYDIQE